MVRAGSCVVHGCSNAAHCTPLPTAAACVTTSVVLMPEHMGGAAHKLTAGYTIRAVPDGVQVVEHTWGEDPAPLEPPFDVIVACGESQCNSAC